MTAPPMTPGTQANGDVRRGGSPMRRGGTLILGAALSLAMLFAAILFLPSLSRAQSESNAGPWSGVIINSGCTVDEAFAEAPKCTENTPGAKLVLYDDTSRQMFELDPRRARTAYSATASPCRASSTATPFTSARSKNSPLSALP